ncbi:MAG: TonB-dependent receptor plug domain-containing protein [Bacteroidales bacterium]|nr:TonB-dependent receptor plug domain-containing protein [Bacteroidales bacterium]
MFSAVGYLSEEIDPGTMSNLEITLLEDIAELEEVIVVGYGTQRKGELTVSVSQLKAEELQSLSKISAFEALGGRMAGVDVVHTSGAPGAGSTIRIRGANSLKSNVSPLIVIDGFPVATQQMH